MRFKSGLIIKIIKPIKPTKELADKNTFIQYSGMYYIQDSTKSKKDIPPALTNSEIEFSQKSQKLMKSNRTHNSPKTETKQAINAIPKKYWQYIYLFEKGNVNKALFKH